MKLALAVDAFILSMKGVKSTKTIHWYQWKLESLIEYLGADRDVIEIGVSDLRRWRVSLAERDYRYRSDKADRPESGVGLSVMSIRGFVKGAKRFFNWLVEEGILESSPAQRLEMPPKPKQPKKGIDPADRLKMIEQARGSVRDYAIIKFIDDTGCRLGGAAGLVLDDLDLAHLRAIVHEKGRGGNHKSREVYFMEDTAAALRAWIDQASPNGEPIFGLTEGGIYQVFKRLAQKAGVTKRWSPHQWRHGCGRRWTQSGMPLGVVSQLFGHEDSAVTVEFYGQFANGELQRLHRKYTLKDDSRSLEP